MILPDNSYKRFWDLIIAGVILYSSIVLPYKIAFVDEEEGQAIDISFDILLAIDIILNFFSAYIDSEDNVIKNRKVTVT